MLATNFSEVRKHLKDYFDKARHQPVIVVRKTQADNVVIISLDEYWRLANQEYVKSIDESMLQVADGKFITKTMDELEALE